VTIWIQAAAERTKLYSPIGLRLLDDFTGATPLGRVEAYLDARDASGNWNATGVSAVKTPSGVVSYPGLERHANVAGLPSRHYRVRLEAEFYVPLYQRNSDGIEFDAFPYNDDHPPATLNVGTQDAVLTPAPNYQIEGHIPVLRGVVVDAANKPVTNALVTQGSKERVLTDSRGTFALPLRWVAANTPVPVDAVDERTGRAGTLTIQLPGSLSKSQKIQIS
jgi:hypothetical protein